MDNTAPVFRLRQSAAEAVRPGLGRQVRLVSVEEEMHHWYEESEIGRHLPQLIGTQAHLDPDQAHRRAVG